MTDLTKFKISDTQYLKINPECIYADECQVCAQLDIDYVDEEKNIMIRFGNSALSNFGYKIVESKFFQNLMLGKMTIDSKITHDLGFEWNQYFEGLIQDTHIDQYHCWSNSHKKIRPYFSSWMYNDKDGNVIFEITPFYPWHGEKKSSPGFITYKEFMKDYKPVLVTKIPKENLRIWVDQARKLQKIYFPEFEKI